MDYLNSTMYSIPFQYWFYGQTQYTTHKQYVIQQSMLTTAEPDKHSQYCTMDLLRASTNLVDK